MQLQSVTAQHILQEVNGWKSVHSYSGETTMFSCRLSIAGFLQIDILPQLLTKIPNNQS